MKRRRREATTAGGMKVAVSPAVGAGPWGWRAGGREGGGVVRLLLIIFGCLACGSGTAGAAAALGAGAERVIFRKVGECPQGADRFSAVGCGRGAEKAASSSSLRVLGYGMAWGSY